MPHPDIQVLARSADHELGYSQFVDEHPGALVSYSLRYRDFLADLLGCEPCYAIAVRDDEVVGIMPLMRGRGELGEVLNSLPYFGSNGGPLGSSEEAHEALLGWYDDQVADSAVAAATVVENPLANSWRPPRHQLTDERIAHITDLTGPEPAEDRVWRIIEGSARRNVKKTKRLGTVVAVENQAFPELEALHRASMEAIGAEVKSHAFFSGVQRHFRAGEDFNLFVARLEDDPVAALLVFYSARTVDYYVPAVDPEHRPIQAMAAILFFALVEAAGRDLTHWNWGGSRPDQEALQRFKAKWGGVPHPYRYWTTVNREELLEASPETLLSTYPGFFVVPFSNLLSSA